MYDVKLLENKNFLQHLMFKVFYIIILTVSNKIIFRSMYI